jgi:hypothetical protein
MASYAFSGASAEVPPYGSKTKIRFIGTWANGDYWYLGFVSSTTGDFSIGKGNISGQVYTCALKLRNRMYLGFTNKFALSGAAQPTLWEDQDAGAAVIDYLSQFGNQDTIQGFASLQGRLAVIAGLSVQIWSVDADPSQMALLQTLDNTGAIAPLSIKSIGDLDVLYLDKSGVRSLRAKESTLNAYVNDVGTAVDLTIRDALVGYDASGVCAVVEPTTKQYWVYINGNIYVLSSHPKSQITAWSTYKATIVQEIDDNTSGQYQDFQTNYTIEEDVVYYWVKGAAEVSLTNGANVLTSSGEFTGIPGIATVVSTNSLVPITGSLYNVALAFTPVKMLAYSGQVYTLASSGKIYRYGGSDNNTYDRSRVTIKTPWLDMKEPSTFKTAQAFDVAWNGDWELLASMNPQGVDSVSTPIDHVNVIDRTNKFTPLVTTNASVSSTFDIGRFAYSAHGTHLQVLIRTNFTERKAKLSMFNLVYTKANKK